MCKIVSDKWEKRLENIYLGLIEKKKNNIHIWKCCPCSQAYWWDANNFLWFMGFSKNHNINKPVYVMKKAPLFGVAYHFQGNPPFWVGCILYGIDILKWPSQITMKWRSNKSDTDIFTSMLLTKSVWDETVQKKFFTYFVYIF